MLNQQVSLRIKPHGDRALGELMPFLKIGAAITVGRMGATITDVELPPYAGTTENSSAVARAISSLKAQDEAPSQTALFKHLSWRISLVRSSTPELRKADYWVAFGQIELALLAGFLTADQAAASHADLNSASTRSFNMDDSIRLAMDARRYQYLRAKSGEDSLLLIAVPSLPGGPVPVGGVMLDTLIDAELAEVSSGEAMTDE